MKQLNLKEQLGQKVLVIAINEFVRRGIISFDQVDDEKGSFQISFFVCGIPAMAHARHIGLGELQIVAVLWPSSDCARTIGVSASNSEQRLRRGEFYAAGWLERKDGAWLQTGDGLPLVACSKRCESQVSAIPWEDPISFKAQGKFYR